MKCFATCLLLLLSLSLTGCGLSYQEFNAPDGSYSVKMPGKPTKVVPIGAANGDGWEVLTRRWNFAVGYLPLPDQVGSSALSVNPSQFIDLMVQGMATQLRGTLKNSTAVNLNGFQGKEAEYSFPAAPNPTSGKQEPATTAVMRFYAVNSKVLFLMVRSTNTLTKDSADVKTFFDSLKLNVTPSAPSGGAGPGGPGMPGNMAGMPGGAMPAGGPGPAGPGYGMTPPPGTAGAGPAGYPVAGASGGPSGYPQPGGYPAPGATGTGGYPMPNGASATPGYMNKSGAAGANGGYPMPAGANGAGPSGPMPNGGYPMPAGGTGAGPSGPMPNGAYPMPPSTYPAPNGTAGANGALPGNDAAAAAAAGYAMKTGAAAGAGQGFNAPGPNGYAGGPGRAGATPTFTGTPVTDETKIASGDSLQVYFNGQWTDVKVLRVSLNGTVQVRSLTKPPVVDVVPRSALQIPPGADDNEVASNDSPRTEPGGLPNSKAASKPKSSGFAKSAETTSDSKPEPSKGTPLVSLDGASVEELLKIIAKKTEHRRVQAAEKLRDHSEAGPNPEVAKKLLELLQADQVTVRNAVAQTLEKWACPEINDAVLKNLKGGTTEVRQSMMKILAAQNVDGNADGIAQCLVNQEDRKVAAEILTSLGESAQGAVIKMLDHRDSKVKVAACDILKEIGSADAVAALTKATSSWSGTDRLAARKALKAVEARK